jgi:transcriptional antiterminator
MIITFALTKNEIVDKVFTESSINYELLLDITRDRVSNTWLERYLGITKDTVISKVALDKNNIILKADFKNKSMFKRFVRVITAYTQTPIVVYNQTNDLVSTWTLTNRPNA